jgi:hypothetical protein
MNRTGITAEQYDILLKPLAASRVANRTQAGRSLAYVEAWDIKAHLIRIFGFGGWSWRVNDIALAFEDIESKDGKTRYSVGYRVTGVLSVPALGCEYAEAAVGFSTLPQRGEAHDMAVKTAESDALKRAAINLGTQFGLSLYNNGSRHDVVGHTLCPPDGIVIESESSNVLSRDEEDALVAAVFAAKNEDDLRTIWETCGDLDRHLSTGERVRELIGKAVTSMREDIHD